jgi:hypothetical protein
MAGAPLEASVTEFGAGALWAIFQALALAVPHAFQIHELFAAVALVVVVLVFQLVIYSAGAPNAAVQLGAYLSQGSTDVDKISFTSAIRSVCATMSGAVVGSVFIRDALVRLSVPVDGMKPPISFFPEYGPNFVLGVELATSLFICALSLMVFPKHMLVGLAGLFIVPVPAALVGVPGIDPAWSFGRAFAAKDFENNLLYLIGPFGGAIAFGLACKVASMFKKGGKKLKSKARKGSKKNR